MQGHTLLQYLVDTSDVTVAKKQEATEYLAELEDYKRLYNETAKLLNSANYRLSQISHLANEQGGLTPRPADFSILEQVPLNQRIPTDGGAFFLHWACNNCLPDDYGDSDSCNQCGKPRTVKPESR